MISILFTKSELAGSKLIRDLTHSASSHMAWMLDDKLVFHSNHKGCHVEWLGSFNKVNKVVYSIDLDLISLEQEEALYLSILKFDGQKYDYGALWFGLFSLLGYKLGLTRLPKANKWGTAQKQLCLEMAKPLQIFGTKLPELDMISPDGLYFYLSKELKGEISQCL